MNHRLYYVSTLFFICCIGFHNALLAQSNNNLSYGLLKNGELYLGTIIKKGKSIGVIRNRDNLGIKKTNVSEKATPVISPMTVSAASPKYDFPNAWSYHNATFYIVGYSEGGNRSFPSFGIFSIAEELLDTIELKKKIEEEILEVNALYKTESERFKHYAKQAAAQRVKIKRKDVMPLKALMRNIVGIRKNSSVKKRNVAYDILYDSLTENLDLFVKDPWHFAHWKTNYPTVRNNESCEWNLVKAYTKDSVYLFKESIYSTPQFLPDEHDFGYKSISDSLFNFGHFKAIKQNNSIFVINSDHGGIYQIKDGAIKKIAQIAIDEYMRVDGAKVFIEDIDSNQLIFFGPVDKIDNTSTPLVYKILRNPKKASKKFKGLIIK